MNRDHIAETIGTLIRGAAGMTGGLIAALSPMQEHIDWGVRVLGAVLGCVVAVLMIIDLWRRMSAKKGSKDE